MSGYQNILNDSEVAGEMPLDDNSKVSLNINLP